MELLPAPTPSKYLIFNAFPVDLFKPVIYALFNRTRSMEALMGAGGTPETGGTVGTLAPRQLQAPDGIRALSAHGDANDNDDNKSRPHVDDGHQCSIADAAQ
jgi:hypothetical protein